MIKNKVVIIDSGINIEKYPNVFGIGIEYSDNGFIISKRHLRQANPHQYNALIW